MTPARLLLLLLLWPLGEILSLLLMAEAVGAFMTFVLVILGVLVGMSTLRLAGRAAVEELRAEARQGGVLDLRILFGASRLAAAGVLLMIPGFLSDIVALLLLGATFLGGRQQRRPPAVIDVEVERRDIGNRRLGGGPGF